MCRLCPDPADSAPWAGGQLTVRSWKRERDQACNPALEAVGSPHADPVATAGDVAALEDIEYLLFAQCSHGSAGDWLGAQHGTATTRVADDDPLTAGRGSRSRWRCSGCLRRGERRRRRIVQRREPRPATARG